MRPTSPDLRQRIVDARHVDGLSMGQIAERFKVPRGTVQNVLERYRDAATIAPRPANAGRRAAFEGKTLAKLERSVLRHPDATLSELLKRSGVQASIVAVHNALKRLGFVRKKNATSERTVATRCRRPARGVAQRTERDRPRPSGVSR